MEAHGSSLQLDAAAFILNHHTVTDSECKMRSALVAQHASHGTSMGTCR